MKPALTALRFLYNITLDRSEVVSKLSSVPVARKLPEILSMDEAKQLIEAALHPKFKGALAVAYSMCQCLKHPYRKPQN